jgi:GT2 family glycosyltransferase
MTVIRRLPLVSAVIVHYKAIEYLYRCLNSLLASSYDPLEIILVCNGTPPQAYRDILKKWGAHPRIKLVCPQHNLGYGGGANYGAKFARGKYIAVLNDDIEFEPNWLSHIVDTMEAHQDIGACQPKVHSSHNPEFFDYAGAAGGMLDIFGYPFSRGRVFWTVEKDYGQYDEPANIFWASGAATIVRRSAWEKVGGFDPIFFLYAEEVDLCWQLHRLGYRVVCEPRSKIYHWGSISTKNFEIRRTFLISRNHLVLILKNYTFWQLCFLFPVRLSLEIINVMYALLNKQPDWAVAILRGVLSVALSPLSIWRSRKKAMVNNSENANPPPFYSGAIVFEYFLRKKTTYGDLYGDNGRKASDCTKQVISAFKGEYQLKDSIDCKRSAS